MSGAYYPKEYRANLAWRAQILQRAGKDAQFRSEIRELFFRDPIFAFNAFFYTLDVRKRPDHNQPFATYPYQDEEILRLLTCIKEGRDHVIEKSRDMGASWIVILCILWCWLNPTGGGDFLLGSRIEDYVDKKGDMRTLLEKARYALYKLPSWLRPKGFSSKEHDNFMRLLNPETRASITGASNNANFSTGGRYAAILFDEFGKWESTDTAAWTAAGDATPCRIAVSTPFGATGQYYSLVTNPAVSKSCLHWTLHPEKASEAYCLFPRDDSKASERDLIRSPWYDKECDRRSPEEIAQELDIAYLGSGNPVFTGKAQLRVTELISTAQPLPITYLTLQGKALI